MRAPSAQSVSGSSDNHVLDWLPLLACHVDGDGRISYLNGNWASFSGLDRRPGALNWTELIDGADRPLPCRCPDALDYCIQRHVILRHHDGEPVETDLHWQKLGLQEGGGWILFAHPEADFPLLQSGLSRLSGVRHAGERAAGHAPVSGLAAGRGSAERGETAGEAPDRAKGARDAGGRDAGGRDTGGHDTGKHDTGASTADTLFEPASRAEGITGSLPLPPPGASLGAKESRFLHTTRRPEVGDEEGGPTKDRLTGLPTWRAFEGEAEALLAAAASKSRTIGYLLVDIDYLGDLNDLYGNDIGDLVLRLVADRLTLLTAGGGLMTRSGDDEFTVLITGEVSPETLAAHAQALLSFVDLPIRIGTQQITFGLSIGAALFPQDGDTLARLQHHAVLAVNDVKARGRGGYRLFDPGMVRPGDGVTAQSNLIRRMLRDDRIYPAYQAMVRLSDNRIIGAEALMRWKHEGGQVSGPEAFPEIFRSYDLATRVSARVHERVFQDLVQWQRMGIMPPHISINVAPVEFMQDDYAEKLLARLDRFGLPAKLIELELTEHVLYQNSDQFIHRALTQLRRAGMRITLDDFGTGYSSLSFLRDFPVSSIKIDRSFIRQICTEASMEVIVEAIIRFGQAVSVDVVAEGVETAEQLAMLRRIGCPVAQGYLFSPPVVSSRFAALLGGSRLLPL